ELTIGALLVDNAAPTAFVDVTPAQANGFQLFGKADDAGGVVTQVQVSVQDRTTNQFATSATGSFTSATEVFFAARGGAVWSADLSALPFVNGTTYRFR